VDESEGTLLLLHGEPIVRVAVGEAWVRRLRNAAPFVRIDGAGHFVAEMQPDELAEVVLG
jgi:pimeloyl-ACP methyl ester carboxylesterase